MSRAELELDFAGAALSWAERELELSDQELGRALRVDRKTIYRWRRRETAPAPEQRRRVEQLTQIQWFLEHAFRTPEIGRRWLHQAVPGLRGRTPISVLIEGDLDRVLTLLATHAAGAHV